MFSYFFWFCARRVLLQYDSDRTMQSIKHTGLTFGVVRSPMEVFAHERSPVSLAMQNPSDRICFLVDV